MLKKGVDLLDQNNEILINRGGAGLSYWIRFKNALAYGIDVITPLRKKTALISIQEDKSVASLFVTFRFLIRISMITMINFSILFFR